MVFYLLLLLLPNNDMLISDTLAPLGTIFSIFIIGWSLKQQLNKYKKAWIAFLLGNILYLFGDMLWFYNEIILKQVIPFPSICDVFYISSTFFYFIAIVFYINIKNIYHILRASFDILITMVVCATLSWEYILMPIYHDTSLNVLPKLVTLAYPITDLSYLTAIMLLFFIYRPRKTKNISSLFIILAFTIWFITDQIYSIENAMGSYMSGNLIDPLWPVGFWVLGIASLWSESAATVSHKNLLHDPSINGGNIIKQRMQVILPYGSCCVLIIIVSMRYLNKDPLIVGVVITALLILIRQVFTLFENRHLISLIKQKNRSLAVSKNELEAQNTQLQKLNYLKEQEAQTDFLTGLYNRRYIDQILKTLPNEVQVKHDLFSLLLMDIDNFKQINDHFGHDVGDIVLQQVTVIIKNNIRSFDIAGRFGGDEFIVILPDADIGLARTIGERLCRLISDQNLTLESEDKIITLSVGCAEWQENETKDSIKSMITRADMALYQAKNNGRNQVVTMS